MKYTKTDELEAISKSWIKTCLEQCSAEERLSGISTEERLKGIATEERLKGVATEDVLSYLSQHDVFRTLNEQQRRTLIEELSMTGPTSPNRN